MIFSDQVRIKLVSWARFKAFNTVRVFYSHQEKQLINRHQRENTCCNSFYSTSEKHLLISLHSFMSNSFNTFAILIKLIVPLVTQKNITEIGRINQATIFLDFISISPEWKKNLLYLK